LYRLIALLILASTAGVACADGGSESSKASPDQLLDPDACRSCHQQHYAEWAQSMHAYAAKDPVFLAQNRQAQQETSGALGDFCIRCHAPMAVLTGASADGLNLEELPQALSGVTCYFCHSVNEVTGTHNNALELASDGVMRGGIRNPVPSTFHESTYSELLDGAKSRSAALCGACHDLVTPPPPLGHAVQLERTFAEWSDSLFAPAHAVHPESSLSCSACHMPTLQRGGIARGGPARARHQHLFPAVDVALTPFPSTGDPSIDDTAGNERAVRELLDGTVRVDVCVQRLPAETFAVEVTLDNVNAGHSFPSGSTHNRDLWVELRAFDDDGHMLYESGVAYDDSPAGERESDLWLLRDRILDESGTPTHSLWKAASIERRALEGAVTNDPTDERFYRNHQQRRFPRAVDASIPGVPTKVSVRVRLRPVPLGAIDELIEAGFLAEEVRERIVVHDLIPNRHLAGAAELSSLGELTFEWSTAVRESGRFDAWQDATSPFVKDCLGMPSKRGRR
jgi:hypothetical protein